MKNRIILDGKAFKVPSLKVTNWHTSGMEFKPGQGARKRTRPPDLGVLHWTGGEGGAKSVFKTLQNRSLGVEFLIDKDGTTYQFADPFRVDTFDAGPYNRRSWGVEMVNHGFSETRFGDAKERRGTYKNTIQGRSPDLDIARFYLPQLTSMLLLVDFLCQHTPTVKRVPRDVTGCVASRTLTPDELKNFSGVVGHFHLSGNKTDPGREPFAWLSLAGY